MINFVLSLDYEIYGDGKGNLMEQMIEPTNRFLSICDKYSVKTTLFAEVAEILEMKKYDRFAREIGLVEKQIKEAHIHGHDIQLHIHPWWFDAQFDGEKWEFDYTKSSLGNFKHEEAFEKVYMCKKYLEELLSSTGKKYECIAFRAGSWSMMPTEVIFDTLNKAKIKVDSSVYKWGTISTDIMRFDYTQAHSNILPWFAKREDINQVEKKRFGNDYLLEIPIYSEHRYGITFVSLKRIALMNKVRSAIIDNSKNSEKKSFRSLLSNKYNFLFKKRSKKLDFCKSTIREMKEMIGNIIKNKPNQGNLPVVSIGHSKDFIYVNDFEYILKHIKNDYPLDIEITTLAQAAKDFLKKI